MTDSATTPRLTTEQLASTDAETHPGVAGPTASPVTDAPGAPPQVEAPSPAAGAPDAALLANSKQFLDRWDEIQTRFVDEPREAVEQADTLVAEVIRELARVFAEERGRLEGAWSQGDDVSTEDLRQALQRYRDFFHVLLRS